MTISFRPSASLMLALVLPVMLAACGSSGGADTQAIEQAKTQAAAAQHEKDVAEQKAKDAEAKQAAQQAKIEKELKELKKRTVKKTTTGSSSSRQGSPAPAPPASSGSSCTSVVSAGPNTSCAFALSVAQAYFDAGGGSQTVEAYSAVTNQTYAMSCSAGAPTVCTGGNNATVMIR